MKNKKQQENFDKLTKKMMLWFDKKNDKLIGEQELDNISIKKLKEIFNVNDKVDPYMINAYDIHSNHIDCIQPHSLHKIDLSKYNYVIHVNNK